MYPCGGLTQHVFGGIVLAFDGTEEDKTILCLSDNPVPTSGNNKITVVTSWMVTLLPGSHTVVLKGAGWNNNCNGFMHPHLNVLVFDKD